MSEPTLYEAIYILDAAMQDEETEMAVKYFEKAVVEAGGEVLGTRDFRTRRLAYTIDDYTHGTYKLLYFFGDGAVVDEVRQELSIRQQVIRARVFVANPHAIVGGMQSDEEKEAEAAAEAAAAAEAEAAAAAEAEAASEAEEEAAEEAGPEAEEAAADEAEADEAEETEEAAPEAEEAAADEAEADEAKETEA